MKILNKIKCLIGKHEAWRFLTNESALLHLTQAIKLGNGTLSIDICRHCGKVMVVFGEASRETLDVVRCEDDV